MICPECNGDKFVSVDGKHIACPTCEGAGELPDRTLYPNNCPACGEPIAADRKWCDFHAAAEDLDG